MRRRRCAYRTPSTSACMWALCVLAACAKLGRLFGKAREGPDVRALGPDRVEVRGRRMGG